MMFPVIRNNSMNWLDNAFDDLFNIDWMPRMNATAPAVNVKESQKAYTMEIAAPGLKKEFCRISITDEGNLSVKIEQKFEQKEDDKKEDKHHYLRREFSYSNYEQTYSLPENVDKEHISAKVEDGILSIELPKMTKEEEKKQQKLIEVS
ncbi:MAG: Hsp20/alpha crystallin family protein [Prevotella sp.]|nr:Hsp20/alpha crystallin family protein [Prevotella sp.]MBQ4446023.1 Hsp20/alpha crystallin family protein [Prevotella sp.]MBQ6032702.1 Hsp20/alpha crystallin family protein [Prevotella sp.]MBQ9570001.1 Hsp20/alpha crystallin family protein [Prevotella sp.]